MPLIPKDKTEAAMDLQEMQMEILQAARKIAALLNNEERLKTTVRAADLSGEKLALEGSYNIPSTLDPISLKVLNAVILDVRKNNRDDDIIRAVFNGMSFSSLPDPDIGVMGKLLAVDVNERCLQIETEIREFASQIKQMEKSRSESYSKGSANSSNEGSVGSVSEDESASNDSELSDEEMSSQIEEEEGFEIGSEDSSVEEVDEKQLAQEREGSSTFKLYSSMLPPAKPYVPPDAEEIERDADLLQEELYQANQKAKDEASRNRDDIEAINFSDIDDTSAIEDVSEIEELMMQVIWYQDQTPSVEGDKHSMSLESLFKMYNERAQDAQVETAIIEPVLAQLGQSAKSSTSVIDSLTKLIVGISFLQEYKARLEASLKGQQHRVGLLSQNPERVRNQREHVLEYKDFINQKLQGGQAGKSPKKSENPLVKYLNEKVKVKKDKFAELVILKANEWLDHVLSQTKMPDKKDFIRLNSLLSLAYAKGSIPQSNALSEKAAEVNKKQFWQSAKPSQR